jgi:hypothetical protein
MNTFSKSVCIEGKDDSGLRLADISHRLALLYFGLSLETVSNNLY